MKTGIKKAGSDLQVVQNDLIVPLWHIADLENTEVSDVPIATTASPLLTSDPLSPAIELGMRIARSQPDIRVARVEALAAEIEAGTYAIDSTAIARKMLNVSFATGPDEQA